MSLLQAQLVKDTAQKPISRATAVPRLETHVSSKKKISTLKNFSIVHVCVGVGGWGLIRNKIKFQVEKKKPETHIYTEKILCLTKLMLVLIIYGVLKR